MSLGFEHLSLFLKNKRFELKYTQNDLAEKLGLAHQFVSSWERGVCAPPAKSFDRLICVLEIVPEELVDVMLKDEKESILAQVYNKPGVNAEKSKIRPKPERKQCPDCEKKFEVSSKPSSLSLDDFSTYYGRESAKPIMKYDYIGALIREKRKAAGLTQKQLSEKLKLYTRLLVLCETGRQKLPKRLYGPLMKLLKIQKTEMITALLNDERKNIIGAVYSSDYSLNRVSSVLDAEKIRKAIRSDSTKRLISGTF